MIPPPAGAAEKRCGSSLPAKISLPVLPSAGGSGAPAHTRTVRKSRTSRWRAVVLIGVHVVMGIHILLWYVSGMRDGVRETLSPVEPSESMFALEQGFVNAGFIFFILAILSTLIFGRFFCGWGCHIVALQDLCGWLMKKCGVHPKPFRSRLLVFVPLIVALYMFVWPTFKREVLYKRVIGPAEWQAKQWGVYLGETAQFPGWSNHLVTENFWQTFAPWYIAIPFIFICTFGIVYFLGNKGFCTYACPYGGFFGPADLVTPGRIVVNDNCEHCGHCTAVCTSNVRVHEEVRDFGMVVDPGCMKCMDCVSVCPNDALSFGFAKPAILAKPRTPEAKERRAKKPRNYDLSWPEEIFLAVVFLVLTQGFRQMLNAVPLLMALAMAGIGTFFVWKLIQMVRTPSTRIHSFQLKFKGKVRPAGLLFILLTLVWVGSALWSAAVRYTKWRGELIAVSLNVPADMLLKPGAKASDADRATAERALAHFRAAGSPRDGGWGWKHRPDELQTIAYLQLVAGDVPATERTLMDIMSRGKPESPLVFQLGSIMSLRGAKDPEVLARFEQILAQQPQLAQIRATIARVYVESGRPQDAQRLYEDGLQQRPGDPVIRRDFALLLFGLNQPQRGTEILQDATEIARGQRKGMRVRENPQVLREICGVWMQLNQAQRALPHLEYLATLKKPRRPIDILATLATVQFTLGKRDEALVTMKQAIDEAAADGRKNPQLLIGLAQMYEALQRPAEAQQWAQKAQEMHNALQQPAPSPSSPPGRGNGPAPAGPR